MAEGQEDKTEPATPKRREDARERGEVAQSRDLSTVLVLAASLMLASSALGMRLVLTVADGARLAWSGEWSPASSLTDYHALIYQESVLLFRAAAPLAGLLMVAAVAAPVAQTGPMFSTKALAFKGSKLDPIKGFKRFFEPERLFELGKALFKLAVIGSVTTAVLAPAVPHLFDLHDVPPASALGVLDSLAFRIGTSSLAVLLVLALADLAWVRYRHEHKLRMSKQEVRDEVKQREGNPEVRARMRSVAQQASRHRMIAEVANADVVVRNPTHFAVALRYARADMGAPTVLAMGRNQVALRILEAARENRVPVVENPPVARLLFRTAKIGREIPESLYEAVAEILAYVYRLDRSRRLDWGARA